MIGNINISGKDNPLGDIISGESRVNSGHVTEGGFISILKESMDYKVTPVTGTDDRKYMSSSVENMDAVRTPDIPAEHNQLKQPGTKVNDYSGNEKQAGPVKKNTERESEPKVSEDIRQRVSEKRKNEKTAEIAKESKNAMELIPHILGEGLLKKISESIRSFQEGDIKKAGEKLKSLLGETGNRIKLVTALYPQDAKIQLHKNENTAKGINSTIQNIVKDILESAMRELGNNRPVDKKKNNIKTAMDPVSTDTTVAVLAGVKKMKIREERGVNQKHGVSEEQVSEKKHAKIFENATVLNKTGDDKHGFDGRNSSGNERWQNRDNSHFNTARLEGPGSTTPDIINRPGVTQEFRQSFHEILEKAKVSVKDQNNGSFTVKLFPKELGNVNVNLVLENGVVNGKFLVDSNDARTLLMSNLENFREQLSESGINVGEFSVNVRDEREKFFRDKNENAKGVSAVSVNESVSAANVYEFATVDSHDGLINMII